MNFLRPITLKYWQVSLFKLALVSFGIFVGAKWPAFWSDYTTAALIIFIAITLYLLPLWWKTWTRE